MRHIICPSLKEPLDITEGLDVGPQGFCGSGDKGYLCSGSWEALVIIFRDLGSILIVWGILQKVKIEFKKSYLKGKPCILFDFFF